MSSLFVPCEWVKIVKIIPTSNREDDRTIPVAAHLLERSLQLLVGRFMINMGEMTLPLDAAQSVYLPQRRSVQVNFAKPADSGLVLSEWKAKPDKNLPQRTSARILTPRGSCIPFMDLTGSCMQLLRNVSGKPIDFSETGEPLGVLYRADSFSDLNIYTRQNGFPEGLLGVLASAASLTGRHPYYD